MCEVHAASIKFSKEFADKCGIIEYNGPLEDVVGTIETAMAYLETANITRAAYARDLVIPTRPEGTDD